MVSYVALAISKGFQNGRGGSRLPPFRGHPAPRSDHRAPPGSESGGRPGSMCARVISDCHVATCFRACARRRPAQMHTPKCLVTHTLSSRCYTQRPHRATLSSGINSIQHDSSSLFASELHIISSAVPPAWQPPAGAGGGGGGASCVLAAPHNVRRGLQPVGADPLHHPRGLQRPQG